MVKVDVLLFETMANKPSLGQLWSCVKALLLLSHGQATVECGIFGQQTGWNWQPEWGYLCCQTANLWWRDCSGSGFRTLIPATSNWCWQLHQLDVSIWPTLKMKGKRRNQVAEERSEQFYIMKLKNWRIRKDVWKKDVDGLHLLMSMRRHTSILGQLS